MQYSSKVRLELLILAVIANVVGEQSVCPHLNPLPRGEEATPFSLKREKARMRVKGSPDTALSL